MYIVKCGFANNLISTLIPLKKTKHMILTENIAKNKSGIRNFEILKQKTKT